MRFGYRYQKQRYAATGTVRSGESQGSKTVRGSRRRLEFSADTFFFPYFFVRDFRAFEGSMALRFHFFILGVPATLAPIANRNCNNYTIV